MSFKGRKIKPLTEFWIDCYSTAIFSILTSYCNVTQEYIYNNIYRYNYDVNEKKALGRVYVKMQIGQIEEELLKDKIECDFTSDNNIIDRIKEYIDRNKIIMIGIDMFYGIKDTLQYQRHHIGHYILIEGYDDEEKLIYILETGKNGYKEYTLTYDEINTAAKNFKSQSYVYTVNENYKSMMYDLQQVKENSIEIIKSIEEVESHIDEIWHVEGQYVLSMRDEIDTHLKSIANRQKANALLLRCLSPDGNMNHSIEIFEQMEKEYFELRQMFIEKCNDGQYFEYEAKIKEKFVELLEREKELWKNL